MDDRSLKIRLLLIIAVIITFNIVADLFWMRMDFTADKRYTLSRATENILSSLEYPVTVTAYFSEDLPPHIASTQNDFKDLLREYASRSNGQVVYEFINPNETEETERQAQMQGISPVMINVRERDQVKQQRAYLGAVIQLGEDRDLIPLIQPGAAMEYALSTSIKKLAIKDKPKVGMLQGHGEPSIAALQQVVGMLSVLYDVELVSVSDMEELPAYYKTLFIVSPTDSFPPGHLAKLDRFMENGGRLMIAMNRVAGDFSNARGNSVQTGLESWLEKKGIHVENNFVLDANCGAVTVRRQQGHFNFNQQVKFPYFPLITKFADHLITNGIESVSLPFVSSISYDVQDTNIHVFPLATTSNKSGKESPDTYFDISKQWTESDFPYKELTVAVLATGNRIGKNRSKLVVFADGDFAVNGEGQGAQQIQKDNANLFVNSVDFLSDDTGLNELRTKGVTSRPIDADLEANAKSVIKYLNFLMPIIIIIIYGLYRVQVRRRRVLKWREERYG
jgi:gliding-associated putative ABC transporter substrate-binding component GldG